MGYLPDATLWIHAAPGTSIGDREMLLSVSSPAEGGGVIGADIAVANASRGELPPTPLTSFVKVLYVVIYTCCYARPCVSSCK